MGTTNGYGPGLAGPSSGPPTNGTSPTPASGGKHYAHFDDIKQVQLDIDSVTPVEHILTYAETCLRQAGFMKDIGRLDMALKEYLKGSIALIEILPHNAAWLSFLTDRQGARNRYNALMGQISSESATYEKIKALIQRDNARTGVMPTGAPSARQNGQTDGSAILTNGHRRNESLPALGARSRNGTARSEAPTSVSSTSAERSRPAVHPKPKALHGIAIKQNGSGAAAGGGGKTAQDLAERFANLRTKASAQAAQSSQPAQQDPRIRTQPISPSNFPPTPPPHQQLPPQQHHRRQSSQLDQFRIRQIGVESPVPALVSAPIPPSATAPSIPLSKSHPLLHSLPDLPKLPEAIYNPARGSISSQAAQLPSSTPRGMFSRTNSATSFSGMTRTPAPQAPTEDYFSSLRSSLDRQPPKQHQDAPPPKRSPIAIPSGDTISAQELLKLMQAGSRDIQILLIDIRSREDYDEGHIMSQSTICIECDILQREHISAGEIADSMVLAPATETRLFDRRREFGLIVFYDQDSESIRPMTDDVTPVETAIVALHNALAYYDFPADSESSRKPKLLKGGLEAWIAMMGASSLQTSTTAAGVSTRASKATTQLARSNAVMRPRTRYMTKPIQDADEAKRWEESLKDMDRSSFVRTTDDFLRRFPPVSAIQESMTSPPIAKDDSEIGMHTGISPRHSAMYEERPASRATMATTVATDPEPVDATAFSTLPAPPTRPAPTVPRPSHSGLEEADDDDRYMRAKIAKAAVAGGRLRRQKVGLYNPGNWCYGNSSFQSLFASGAFSEELTTGEWSSDWKVPMKSDEKISHPQLLAKILANSFHWMQYGKFEAMKAKTLMDYCYHIHSRDFDGSTKTDRSTIFGGPYQQDAQEFISFLLTNLHDETNRLRDRTGEVQQPTLGPRSTALGNALLYWQAYRQYNDSLVDKYWRGVEVTDRRCRSCGHPSLTYEPFDALHLPIPAASDGGGGGSSVTSITDLLSQYCSADVLPEYRCDGCRRIDTTDKRVRLVRLPDLLCLSFRRFQGNEHFGFHKNNTAVVFPVDGLDMTPFSVQGVTPPADQAAEALDRAEPQFRGPFLYDCYAVIVHSGTLKSGHYRAFVRDEGGDAGGSGSSSTGGGGGGGGNGSSSSIVNAGGTGIRSHLWHHFDDARVEAVTIGTGDGRDMARRLYKDSNGASAYMVFYKRRI